MAAQILNLAIMLAHVLAPECVIADDRLCMYVQNNKASHASSIEPAWLALFFCTLRAIRETSHLYKYVNRFVDRLTNCEYYKHVSGQESTLNIMNTSSLIVFISFS